MQIYSDKLTAQLKQSLSAVYLVAGDDELLRDEALTSIRKAARENFSIDLMPSI